MHLLFSSPATNNFITAFSWTLIHSLWQALVVAIAGALIMMLTRRSTSRFRYNLLSCLFLLLLASFVGTFIWEYSVVSSAVTTQVALPVAASSAIAMPAIDSGAAKSFQLMNEISAFLTSHAFLIAIAWFLIFAVKSAKLMADFAFTRHIIRHSSANVPLFWKQRLSEFCRQIGLNKPVTLLESPMIKVPAVFGHLKPIIFIPLGMLTAFPPEQVEAILLHELAHIRRNDFFTNLMQNIVETVFFFNPAALWLSSTLREERENCCDDFAIGSTNNRRQFLEALISTKEYSIADLKFTTAFTGKRNQFLNRIKRIVTMNNHTLSSFEKMIFSASLIVICVVSFAFLKNKDAIAPIAASKVQATDTIPALDRNFYAVITRNGKEYKVARKQGRVTAIYVDGQAVAENEIPTYMELISGFISEDKKNAKVQAKQTAYTAESAQSNTVDTDSRSRQKRQSGKEAAKNSSDLQKIKTDIWQKESGILASEVIKNLISLGIVKDTSHLTFSLSENELLVNGQAQPAGIFSQMKAKYLGKPNEFISYSKSSANSTPAIVLKRVDD